MNVYISQPRGKENLVKAFEEAGAKVLSRFDPSIRLIIPTVDEELPVLSDTASVYRSQGIKVMVPSEYTVFETRNKAEFYRFCLRHGFPAVPTMQDNLIAKPTYGKGTKGFIRLNKDYVIQPFIDWPEYSADYFADWEGNPLSCIQRQRLEVINGESTKAKIVFNLHIHHEILRLGKELGLIGHNVIQYFANEDDFKLIEVNTRFGGGSHLTFPIFNSPKWLMEHL